MKKKLFILVICFLILPIVVHGEVTGKGTLFLASDEAMTDTTLDKDSITITPNESNPYVYFYVCIDVTEGSITEVDQLLELSSTNFTLDENDTINSYDDWLGSGYLSSSTLHYSYRNYTGVTTGKHVIARVPLLYSDVTETLTVTYDKEYANLVEDLAAPRCVYQNGNNYGINGDVFDVTKDKEMYFLCYESLSKHFGITKTSFGVAEVLGMINTVGDSYADFGNETLPNEDNDDTSYLQLGVMVRSGTIHEIDEKVFIPKEAYSFKNCPDEGSTGYKICTGNFVNGWTGTITVTSGYATTDTEYEAIVSLRNETGVGVGTHLAVNIPLADNNGDVIEGESNVLGSSNDNIQLLSIGITPQSLADKSLKNRSIDYGGLYLGVSYYPQFIYEDYTQCKCKSLTVDDSTVANRQASHLESNNDLPTFLADTLVYYDNNYQLIDATNFNSSCVHNVNARLAASVTSQSCVSGTVDSGSAVYYCKSGEICPEAQYESECVSKDEIDNPATGSYFPYIILLFGFILSVALIFISRKNYFVCH